MKKHEALEQAQKLVGQMTLEEKLKMIGGTSGFFIHSFDRLNISEVMMADATGGIRIRNAWEGKPIRNHLESSTAFPCPITLASTWNTELCASYAQNVGEECRAGGVGILLGPGMNIYRQSQCGRNFEYFGEDPFLVSSFIRQYVKSLQNTGVVATIKHLIANNTEYHRKKSNSVISERALREIYLPAFKAGVEAGAKAVMTSYNLYNGEWCSQSKELITTLLREELGFDWLVMTDWWAIYDCEKAVKSGLDIEMPASEIFQKIPELLSEGKVEEKHIDRMCISIVKTCLYMDLYDPDFRKPELLENYPIHEQTALDVAREGVVLLKNNGILPLGAEEKILLTGKWAEELPTGGGAAVVQGYNHHSMVKSLTDIYGDKVEYVADPTDEQIKSASKVILSTGTFDTEGCDRTFALPDEEEALIKRVLWLNANTVVVVNSGSGIKMTDWINSAAAVLYAWYPGQIGLKAVAEIIAGEVNPSAKLPFTIERDFADSPATSYLPENAEFYEDWKAVEKKGTHPVWDTNYDEGIFVGYRWFDKNAVVPLFPFGYGLSYSKFKYSDLYVDAKDLDENGKVQVVFRVKNTSEVAGKEIVQVYVGQVDSPIERAVKELKGFDKIELAPGQNKLVSISLNRDDLRYWCEEDHEWKFSEGEYKISVGGSSINLELNKTVNLY